MVGDGELCVDVRAYVEGVPHIEGMWDRLPRVDTRCTSPEEQAENWKDTEEMHTVSKYELFTQKIVRREERAGIQKWLTRS